MTVRFARSGDTARTNRQRIRVLEARSRGSQQEDTQAVWVYWEEVFDYSGGADPSKKYSPPFTCELVEAFGTLTSVGSSATTADLFINEGAHETLTIAASADRALITVRHVLQRRTDDVQFEATLGTGADGLLIHALFRRRS